MVMNRCAAHRYSSSVWTVLLGLVFLLSPLALSQAEVVTNITSTPPSSGGLNTHVTQSGTTWNITEGTRPGCPAACGPNLFHSFGQFDVGAGDVANFQNTQVNGAFPATANILSRVTGGNQSQIYGTIRTTDFGSANLFLMNPAGVLFGATAVLDLGAVSGSATSAARDPGGSFYATTADYLKLVDAAGTSYFYANPAKASVLSVAPVVAFGFLINNPASIAIQGGNLEVSDGQTLSFIGGPRVFTPATGVPVPSGVTMTAGHLSAPNGLIYMETVTALGETPLPTLSGNPLGSPVSFPGSENAVIFVQSGELVMKGASLLTATTGPTSGAPIDIDVGVAGQFTMQNGSTLSSSTTGEGQGGAINVSASTLAMDASSIKTETSGDGHAGVITVNVGKLSLTAGAQINSQNASFGLGEGGNVKILATDSIMISGQDSMGNPSGILADTQISGDGGSISLTAKSLTMGVAADPEGIITADPGGIITARTFGSGPGGEIDIAVDTMSLSNGGRITSFTATSAPGGKVNVTATDSIFLLSGVDSNGNPSGILTSSSFDGQTGDIKVDTGKLTLSGGSVIQTGSIFDLQGGSIKVDASNSVDISNGSSITSQAFLLDVGDISISTPTLTMDNGSIQSTTLDFGNAGNIVVNVGTLSLSGGARIDSGTIGPGRGGTVTVQGFGGPDTRADAVKISGTDSAGNPSGLFTNTGKAGIFENPFADGVGGNIKIVTNTLTLADGASISAASSSIGDGGSVTINASGSFTSNASTVSTSAEKAKGGDILIDAQSVQLSNGTLISASSNAPLLPLGAGNAGNITIHSGSTFLMNNSKVTTEATQASGGTIKITAPEMVRLINSRVSTSVGGSVGVPGASDGGNINIDPQFVVLQNSQILAQAFAGAGGAITITATSAFIADPASIVDASSTLGINGPVFINTPLQNVGGRLTPLSQKFSSAAALLAQRCAARAADGKFSTFVVAGREGLPAEPGGFLASPSLTAELFGSSLSGRDRQTQFPAVTGLFPEYDARPIQLAMFGNACH
jgi:filamentous hemagglutinin family protein